MSSLTKKYSNQTIVANTTMQANAAAADFMRSWRHDGTTAQKTPTPEIKVERIFALAAFILLKTRILL